MSGDWQAIAWILAVGVFATLFMDGVAWLRARLLGQRGLDWAMVGRWLGHVAKGSLILSNPQAADPMPFERALGWGLHCSWGGLGGVFVGAVVLGRAARTDHPANCGLWAGHRPVAYAVSAAGIGYGAGGAKYTAALAGAAAQPGDPFHLWGGPLSWSGTGGAGSGVTYLPVRLAVGSQPENKPLSERTASLGFRSTGVRRSYLL